MMPAKKTGKALAKKAQKIKPMPTKATVHIEGCSFENTGPGQEQLAVMANIADALKMNAEALNTLANSLENSGALLDISNIN